MRAQTSMILLVLVIIIFAALAVFLFSLAQTVSQKDYMNMYTSNMLLSIFRTDTGSNDPECKYISDAISCAFFSPHYQCPGAGQTCRELAESMIGHYMDRFAETQQSFRYLFTVTPGGFLARTEEGEPLTLEFGDPALKNEKVQKWSAGVPIQKVSGMTEYYLNVNLIVSLKP
jgi:hypothetical protein